MPPKKSTAADHLSTAVEQPSTPAATLPSSEYVDKIVGSLERHPFGTVMLLLLIVAIGAVVYVAKH